MRFVRGFPACWALGLLLLAPQLAAPVRVGGRGTRAVVTLPNGVRLILEENHAAPVVALQAWVVPVAGVAPEPRQIGSRVQVFVQPVPSP